MRTLRRILTLGALPPNPRNFPLFRQNGFILGSGLRPPPAHSGR